MNAVADQAWQDAEIAFLENLRPQYEDKGYRFVVHPNSSDLPPFFSSYEPDAVAFKSGHNVAIEVKSRASSSAQRSIQSIRRLFEDRPDWQFTVAYLGSDAINLERLPTADRMLILERVREVERLAGDGHVREAFIVAWSLLEAALNSVKPHADKRPRTPGTVVQSLAMDGYIADELERSLRALISLRNRIVHGDLAAEPTLDDVKIVLEGVVSTLSEADTFA